MSRPLEPRSADEILSGPQWLLAGYDPVLRRLMFVETTRELLVESAFIDGRTPLSTSGKSAVVPLDRALQWLADGSARSGPDRIVANVGFCGSSLLARALDATEACLSYKEPQVLLHLSDLKTAGDPILTDAAAWRGLLEVVRSQFRKSFEPGGATMIKPSAAAVGLLPNLCGPDARVVFMTVDPRDYLISILRGGQERVGFLLKFLSTMRCAFEDTHAAVTCVERDRSITHWQKIFRLALIALMSQENAFARVMAQLPFERRAEINGRLLIENPEATLKRVCEVLDVPARRAQRKQAIKQTFACYSKRPWAAFDPHAQEATNKRIVDGFGREMDQALAWREARFCGR